METGAEKRAAGSEDAGGRRRLLTALHGRRVIRPTVEERGRARHIPLVLAATAAAVALAAALFAGFRDSGNAHRADAAAIATTQFAVTGTQSAGAPANDNFNSEAYIPTPFTFPGNTFDVSF